MPAFRREVHTASVVKPTPGRDADTGATKLDYTTPISTRTLKGFLSTRGGSMSVGDEGLSIAFDAVFFVKDTTIAENDAVTFSVPALSEKFVVVATEPKYRLRRGSFDHNEVVLRKDNRR